MMKVEDRDKGVFHWDTGTGPDLRIPRTLISPGPDRSSRTAACGDVPILRNPPNLGRNHPLLQVNQSLKHLF